MSLIFHYHARRLNLRIIAPDRPGYGGSTPHPGRHVKGHVNDVTHLMRALGITKFGVLASSAGTMVSMGAWLAGGGGWG